MLIALAAAALIVSGEEPGDPDGVVATAPAGAGAVLVGAVAPTADASPDAATAARVTPQTLTTQEQIDRWISARTPDVEPFADDAGDDRQVHGFASVGVGTNDYSSFAVGVSVPVGENGRVDLSYSETKNGYGYGYPRYGYGYPGYGHGPAGYGAYPGDYGYGLGYHARPFGAGAFSSPGRSRSMSLGFRWDEDKDRDERRIRLPSAEN